jgi:hypothetical protein
MGKPMIRLALTVAVLVSPFAAHAAPLQVLEVWGRFVETSSAIVAPSEIDTVEIDRAAEPIAGVRLREVWLLRRTTVTLADGGRKTFRRWADSRSCSTLIPTLAKLADVEAVAIQPPGRPYPVGDLDAETAERLRQRHETSDSTVFDAGTFELEAKGHWPDARMSGVVTMKSGAETPAADWIADAFKALSPCWTATDPTR